MKKVLLVLVMLFFVLPVSAMICLDDTDTLEGGASVDAVVDYTVHGLVGTAFTNIAQGQLSVTDPSVLYTAGAGISIVSVIYVNTHSSAVTVNLYLDPANAATPRRMIPKNLSLGIGYSMHFDGARCTIIDASGNIVTSYGTHATKHTDGTDDIRDATNALKGLATAAHITAIEVNTTKTTNATHTGEVTGATALTITADAVTYDKMQDTSASDKLLGRSTAGAGTVEEIACTATGRAILASNALTRYLYWSPAYDGYALSADGGSNDAGDSGILVAFAGTLGDSAVEDTPYIELSSTTAGVTDYDVIVRVPIPADYSSMGTFRVEYDSETVLEDTATISIYDSTDAADSSVVLSSSTWAVDETMSPSGTYTAGAHMTIKLHLEVAQNQKMRVGEIRCSYTATR